MTIDAPVRVQLGDLCRRVSRADFRASIHAGNVSSEVFSGGDVVLHGSRLSGPILLRSSHFASPSYPSRRLYLNVINDAVTFGTCWFYADSKRRIVTDSVEHWDGHKLTDESLLLRLRRRTRLPLATYRDAPITKRLKGTYLFARSGFESNPFHWHHDLLPLVSYALELLPDVPFRVLIHGGFPYMESSLLHLGVPPERIIVAMPDEVVSVERMIVLTADPVVAFPAPANPRILDIFTTIKASARPAPLERRKVFVSRGSSDRRLLFERAEVEARFAHMGYAVINPGALPYEEQIELFDSASIVVGEHGGGLFNIGFCRPGTPFVELFHPWHNDLCYFAMSQVMGMRYAVFVGSWDGVETPKREWSADPEAVVDFVRSTFPEEG